MKVDQKEKRVNYHESAKSGIRHNDGGQEQENEKLDADCADLMDTNKLNHSSTLVDTETGSTI
jgi:hypothetical protein